MSRLTFVKVMSAMVLLGICASAQAEQAAPAAPAQETAMTIQDNMKVGLEYTLTSEGAVVDSTDGKEPFHYVQGQGQIIPGLERQLVGLHVGDTKEVTVTPEEGYGVVDQAAFIKVEKKQLPKDVPPHVGMMLTGKNPDGRSFRARISEIKDDQVTLDLNHPLAGKTLVFKVKIIDIAPVKVQ